MDPSAIAEQSTIQEIQDSLAFQLEQLGQISKTHLEEDIYAYDSWTPEELGPWLEETCGSDQGKRQRFQGYILNYFKDDLPRFDATPYRRVAEDLYRE